MNKTLLAALLAGSLTGCASAPGPAAIANDEHWTQVGVFDVRKGSFEFKKNNNDMPLATIIARDRSMGRTHFYRMGVTAEDCGKGMGKLVEWDLDGKLIESYDYVRDGGNNGSALADSICGVAEKFANNQRNVPDIQSAPPTEATSGF
ncbi:MAG: hypothetical protein JNK68_14665 [Betaproteobacteria bacterium]|nr:hypothetical protein [Betaproteobacteria bacterium]